MAKKDFTTSKKERMGYYSYFVGQNMLYLFVLTYLSIYFTNTLGIPAATVGTIFLVARVWDAINDPMLSVFIEKANFKSGKFKPWIKSVALALPLCTILLFGFSDILINASLSVRIAYASVLYIAWGMIYTISDAPAYALSTIMTDNQDERATLISNVKLFGILGIFIVLLLVNPINKLTGGNMFITSTIISILSCILLFGVNFAKERTESKVNSPTVKDVIDAIIKNKYLVIFVIVLVSIMATNFSNVLNAYVATDLFGNPNLIAILSLLQMAPMLIIVPFIPMILKKVSKYDLIKYSTIGSIILAVISYFAGYDNMVVFIVLSVLKGVCLLPITIVSALFFIDCIEYQENKTGVRYEAATFSAQTFSNKAIGAFSGAIGLWVLGLVGYVSSTAGETVIQTEQALSGLWAVYTLGPVIGCVIGLFVFIKFYDLTDEKVKVMMEENAERRAKRSDDKAID